MARDVCQRIADVLSAIEKAERFSRLDRSDEVVLAAVLHELTVVGEAVNALLRDDPELQNRQSAVPWRGIVGMRNRLVHEYERVDPDFVWGVLDTDLSPMRLAVESERSRRGCS